MHTILEMRRARMTYRAIAKELKIDESSVRESHARAKKYLADSYGSLPATVRQGITADELVRIEELEFADARLRDYLEVYKKCMSGRKPSYFNAIQALNGSHKYFETIVKIQGVSAPVKHEVSVTVEDLRKRLEEIEGEIGAVSEAEILEFDLSKKIS
jgi:predicted transcriptional regulator